MRGLEDIEDRYPDLRMAQEQPKEYWLEQTAKSFLVEAVGLDADNPHHRDTPKRFAKMLKDLTTPEDFNFTCFDNAEDVHDMVVLGPMPFYTLCAHHIVPFYGSAYVAYVPGDRIAGLSKFARATKNIAKGLWAQENLTHALADYLCEKLEPMGVAVVMKAEHLCMAMRGVEMAGVITTTSAMRGVFADHDRTAKAEFLEWVKSSGRDSH